MYGFFLVLFVFAPVASPAAEPYSWPIESPTYLTSTFAEYRGDHLHNGIDFSTGRSLSRTVKAIDAGAVQRVFFDPGRYGKTVVLEHSDGRRSWYSHLSRLSEKIRERIGGPIEPDRTIRFDRPLNIARSESVGQSGRTGSGPGHLHVALQSADGDFLNPVNRFEPDLPFDPIPRLGTIHFYPLSGSSWIEGRADQVTFEQLPRRPVEVWGKVGIDLSVWNKHRNHDATSLPAEITLKRDGEVLKQLSFHELSRDEQKSGLRTFFNEHYSNLSPTQFTLHLTPTSNGNQWVGTTFEDAGKTGTFTVIIRTRTGNRKSYSLPYEVVPPPEPVDWQNHTLTGNRSSGLESIRPVNANYLLASLKDAQFAQNQYSPPSYEQITNPRINLKSEWKFNRLHVELTVENRWKGWPSLRVIGKDFRKQLELIQVQPGRFVSWWTPDWSHDGWYRLKARLPSDHSGVTVTEKVYLQSLQPRKPGSILSLDGRYSVFSTGKKLNVGSFVTLKPTNPKPIREELEYVESPRIIKPEILKSGQSFELTVDLSDFDNVNRIGLYRWNPVGRQWGNPSFREGFTDTSRVAELRNPGTVALIRDTTKPRIGSPELIKNGSMLMFPVNENGSGIDRSSLAVKQDNETLPAFWDADRKRVKLNLNNIDLNSRKITLNISDRAGNGTSWVGYINRGQR